MVYTLLQVPVVDVGARSQQIGGFCLVGMLATEKHSTKGIRGNQLTPATQLNKKGTEYRRKQPGGNLGLGLI